MPVGAELDMTALAGSAICNWRPKSTVECFSCHWCERQQCIFKCSYTVIVHLVSGSNWSTIPLPAMFAGVYAFGNENSFLLPFSFIYCHAYRTLPEELFVEHSSWFVCRDVGQGKLFHEHSFWFTCLGRLDEVASKQRCLTLASAFPSIHFLTTKLPF